MTSTTRWPELPSVIGRNSVFTLALALMTVSLHAQWNVQTPGQMSTENLVAIGVNSAPVQYTSLRLTPPAGDPALPCTATQTDLWKCFQLSFSTPTAMWFGFRLSANNDLQLIRQSNGGWREGVTFARDGRVSVHGGLAVTGVAPGVTPVRVDTPNSGGFGLEIRDLDNNTNGVMLDLKLNSTIAVSNLMIGHVGIPLLRSNTTAPLYLNLFSPTSNVVIGNPEYTAMGLQVETNGKSFFRGVLGIGTTMPSEDYKLDVVGDARFSGTVSGANIKATFQDVAEWVPSVTTLPPSTLVVLDKERPNHVTASMRAYDTSVAGVVSAQPGITLGEAGPSKALIATTGRVRLRVDASRHPIAIGDLLVTSDKPGLAMKSVPIDLGGVALHRPGTVVGKALEPLESGEGLILVLLSLQ